MQWIGLLSRKDPRKGWSHVRAWADKLFKEPYYIVNINI